MPSSKTDRRLFPTRLVLPPNAFRPRDLAGSWIEVNPDVLAESPPSVDPQVGRHDLVVGEVVGASLPHVRRRTHGDVHLLLRHPDLGDGLVDVLPHALWKLGDVHRGGG